MKILVADDEAMIRETIAEYLARHGHEILTAANGLEALLHVKHSRPDAVVLDLRMPRLGGIDALRRMQAFDPSIMVVVVTGDPDEAVHREASALGARAVLVKPVSLAALVAALGAGDAARASGGPHGAVPVTTPERPATPASPRGDSRVLVIDDDAAVRTVLTEVLTSRGYEVSQAAGAAAGLSVLADTRPDVVLLDIAMPGLSGVDALPTLRAAAPRAAIIMISGTADDEVANRTLAWGAFDYLVKPIDSDLLVETIEAALAMKALEP